MPLKIGRGTPGFGGRIDSQMCFPTRMSQNCSHKADRGTGILARAFRRAARCAFLWPENVVELAEQNRSLTELRGIGPFIQRQIQSWLDRPLQLSKKIPPIRRDFISLAEARHLLAIRPEWSKSLRGDLQMHSTWSDGSGTISEMAEAAQNRSYEYIAITDHSKGLKIARGIDERALKRQGTEIAKLNASISKSGKDLIVLRSIEMNLDPRGQGDMSSSSLSGLDPGSGFISLHAQESRRSNPAIRCRVAQSQHSDSGHPRGRIYNFRVGLKADWPRVFAEAARLNKALEIDSYPDRQDLNVQLLKLARAHGTRISLGTDAHHPWQLEFIDLGLAAAIRARIPATQIANFMPVTDLRRWIHRLRTPKHCKSR